MVKLVATVPTALGDPKHSLLASAPSGELASNRFPPAARVGIEPNGAESSSFFLIRYDSERGFAGDRWHKTLEDARSQAVWEFKIPPDAWTEITVPDDDSESRPVVSTWVGQLMARYAPLP